MDNLIALASLREGDQGIIHSIDGGTTLTWTMATAPSGPRPPKALAGLLTPGNRKAIAGIKKILP